MLTNQRGAQQQVGYDHSMSNKCEWNNGVIKNNQDHGKILLISWCKKDKMAI